jgi:hypothetical protein
MRKRKSTAMVAAALLLASGAGFSPAEGYVLHRTIARSDPRNTGVRFCPLLNHFDVSAAGAIDRRWDTALGSNIATAGGGVTEVDGVIRESFQAWAQVSGSGLTLAALGPLMLVTGGTNNCTTGDGVNSICFAQPASFASGVLAFTEVLAADVVGQTAGAKSATFVGQILDADTLLNPAIPFATPGALAANPKAYDLESVLIHELGHFLGFSHSLVLRAMMNPFAPPVGTFTGDRPNVNAPDAPLSDDDRAGLRVLYPGSQTFGVIRGRILPANPLSLANLPATSAGQTVTGYYGTHVVAVDADTGQVTAGTLGGYFCDAAMDTSIFDGSYEIGGLPLGHRYKVYVEPLDGPVPPAEIAEPLHIEPCRPGTPNNCFPPAVNTNFTTKIRP